MSGTQRKFRKKNSWTAAIVTYDTQHQDNTELSPQKLFISDMLHKINFLFLDNRLGKCTNTNKFPQDRIE